MATLYRDSNGTAVEGLFRCCLLDIATNTISSSVSVGIYPPSKCVFHGNLRWSSILSVILSLTTVLSVFATIEVVSGREKFFRVTCTTTGGQALKMNVEGLYYSSVEPLQVKVVGERQRVGIPTMLTLAS